MNGLRPYASEATDQNLIVKNCVMLFVEMSQPAAYDYSAVTDKLPFTR